MTTMRTTKGRSADELVPMQKVHEIIEAVSLATKETDQGRLVELIERALAAPIDLYDQDTALGLAKAAIDAGPVPMCTRRGGGIAWARDAVAVAELAKANGVAVHPEQMRSLHNTVEALEVLREIQPTPLYGRRSELEVGRHSTVLEALGFRARGGATRPLAPA